MMKPFSFLLLLGIALATLGLGPQRASAQTTVAPGPTCTNLLTNGTMEADNGWVLTNGVRPAAYIEGGRSGNQALLLESAPATNSSAPQWVAALQKIALPDDSAAELSFWYQLEVAADSAATQTQVALLDDDGELLQVLLSNITPAGRWQQASADISAFAGKTVQVYIAAAARAGTGQVSLLIDDVELCDPGSAPQEPAPTARPLPVTAPATFPTVDPAALVGFRDLKIDTITLAGPSDTAAASFRLPADWKIADGAALQLSLETAVVNEANETSSPAPAGAALEVSLNGMFLRSIAIETLGGTLTSVPLPAAALAAQAPNAPQRLVFQLKSGVTCLARQQLRLAIGSDSRLVLPHTSAPIAPTLAALPSPIVQGTIDEDRATIVVADQPSAGELQAAMIAAAALGRMSDGGLALDLTTVGALDEAQRSAGNLIFVGTAATLQQVSDLPQADAGAAQPGDGVVQIAASPWNPARAVLILSGDGDDGVIKAGQAFSSETLAAGGRGSSAVISNVSAQPSTNRVEIDRSFGLLGYDAQSITGSGAQTLRYRFIIPSGAAVSGEAYLDVTFNHSADIDYTRSEATVAVNGQSIGALTLDETSTKLTTLRVTIPRSVTRPGHNELAITAHMHPRADCVATDERDMWLTVWPESLLHLPINPAQSDLAAGPSPSDYPAPFTFDASLGETAMVLPKDDRAAWNTAAQLAFDLGRQAQGTIIDLSAHYSDTLDEETRASHNLILVGRPDTLPIVAELGESLRVAASAGGDQMSDMGAAVSYRLAEESDIGKLEAIVSPWNDQRTLLAVFGGSPAALQQASTALIDPALRQRMGGSVALINAGQVIASETRTGATASADGNVSSGGTSGAVDISQPEFRRPSWIVPTIALSALLIFAILGYVVYSTILQRRPQQ